MTKHLVKNGKKIRGYVYQDKQGLWWYAFGKPSKDSWMAFACRDLEHGIACVEMSMNNL